MVTNIPRVPVSQISSLTKTQQLSRVMDGFAQAMVEGRRFRHQQRRIDAFARDVTHVEADTSIVELKNIEENLPTLRGPAR